MTWIGFGSVLIAFFVTHSVPVRPVVKSYLTSRLTPRGFTLAYSALSLVMLFFVTRAAARAPYVHLWGMDEVLIKFVLTGMFGVCLLLGLAIGRPNPFSFGGAKNDTFDPSHPGIIRWTRHPILLALGLWAVFHTLANGDLAHVLLFVPLGIFAFVGMKIVDRKRMRLLGPVHWEALYASVVASSYLPAPSSWSGTILRLALGAGLFAALILLHRFIAGVSLF